MNSNNSIASKINQNGWRQGSCLRVADSNTYPQGIHSALDKHGLYVIISQSCDVVQPDLIKEPKIELLLMKPIVSNTLKGDCTKGKNPRILHFTCANDSSFECLAKDRFFLPREYLATIQPDKNIVITGDTLHLLIDWIIKRYRRSAFPDVFNERIRTSREKIKVLLKNHGKDIFSINISLAPDNLELKSSDSYKLKIYALIEPAYYNDKYLSKIEDAIEAIVKLLKETAGIEVLDYAIRSLDEISVAEHGNLKEWDFDYLSF